MQMRKIPRFPKKELKKDLKVTSYIGKDGYKESKVIKAGSWRCGDIVYVHNETSSVVFRTLDRNQ